MLTATDPRLRRIDEPMYDRLVEAFEALTPAGPGNGFWFARQLDAIGVPRVPGADLRERVWLCNAVQAIRLLTRLQARGREQTA